MGVPFFLYHLGIFFQKIGGQEIESDPFFPFPLTWSKFLPGFCPIIKMVRIDVVCLEMNIVAHEHSYAIGYASF